MINHLVCRERTYIGKSQSCNINLNYKYSILLYIEYYLNDHLVNKPVAEMICVIVNYLFPGITTGIEESTSTFNCHANDGDDRVGDQPTLVYTQALNYIRKIKERSAEQGMETVCH